MDRWVNDTTNTEEVDTAMDQWVNDPTNTEEFDQKVDRWFNNTTNTEEFDQNMDQAREGWAAEEMKKGWNGTGSVIDEDECNREIERQRKKAKERIKRSKQFNQSKYSKLNPKPKPKERHPHRHDPRDAGAPSGSSAVVGDTSRQYYEDHRDHGHSRPFSPS